MVLSFCSPMKHFVFVLKHFPHNLREVAVVRLEFNCRELHLNTRICCSYFFLQLNFILRLFYTHYHTLTHQKTKEEKNLTEEEN